MLQLELQPETEARLAEEANAEGVQLSRFVESVLTRYIADRPRRASVTQAVARIRELREDCDIAPYTVRELISEGRKY